MAQPLTHISGKAYPFGMKNCDTDVIIGAEWLKTISRQGLGRGAFESLRTDPAHILNDPAFAGSPILIAGDNFGCGSSREHAAWALSDFGIKAVVAPSFSDIFASNAFKNGILTICLPQATIEGLMEAARRGTIDIDVAAQQLTTSAGGCFRFALDPFRKHCLLNGLDEIGLTLGSADRIRAHETGARRPPLPRPLAVRD
ncbi:MAG: 3-isopropylmalate dehydratase small subunit [Sphingopyxis sp.]